MTFRPVLEIALVVLLAAGCQRTSDPGAALARFYANDGPECTIKVPLIDATPEVIPLVIDAIGDPRMPRRRYAIGYLGEVGAAGATGPLLAIIENGAEKDYFRADALVSLQAIDPARAHDVARKLDAPSDLLGDVSREIGAGKIVGRSKSAWKRFWERPCD